MHAHPHARVLFSPPGRYDFKALDDKDDPFVGIADHRKTEFEKNGAGKVDMKLFAGMSDSKAMYGTTDDATLRLRHTMTVDGNTPQVPMVPHCEDGIEAAKTGIATIRTMIANPARSPCPAAALSGCSPLAA